MAVLKRFLSHKVLLLIAMVCSPQRAVRSVQWIPRDGKK